ncbi:MAG TPA: gamma-glutamyl-gamma-aminobutyrate hydrolase family protein [Gaiellaceae bacterium]|jgi:gamma-glutamyl-gamma-aminobutyrate hydrolase PuuD|nr:gamma-glutamyl-gamma-aminobutyrate hydrolase family protein [Gaiellaceae bacterium]
MRPLIGITTYVTPARWGYWELEASLIPHSYVMSVEEAGGRPLLVPPSEDGVDETLDALDGIVFSGGSDLDPEHYDAVAHPETFGIHPERDRSELELMRAALERDMPVLGICRGIQVMNVARGGDLHQHLPEIVGHEGHKHDPPGRFVDHDVTIEPETKLGQILGERHPVKSHHHQGLDAVGEGLRVSAHAEDGSVEGIEDPSRRFALGVLWHPEAGENKKLFEALVEQAREYKQARAA